MSLDTNIKAIIYLKDKKEESDYIKRLALLFDEIHYVLPHFRVIKQEALNNPKRIKKYRDGRIKFLDFDYFRDTNRNYRFSLDSLNRELQETLTVFEEKGIAEELQIESLTEKIKNDRFENVRDLMISLDVADAEFNRLSETKLDDYDIYKLLLWTLVVKYNDSDDEEYLHLVDDPQSISDSYEITTTLYLSQITSSLPVFLNPRHRLEMEYRYNQYKQGLQILQDHSKEILLPSDFKACFGEVVFNVANSVFSSDIISRKAPSDIVKYRNAMDDSRKQYLSGDLIEITSLLKENPWNIKTKNEFEKYIIGKLRKDLLTYDKKSRETWEKLFGNIIIHLAELSKSSILGGSAGGLLGNLIPNTSVWEMLMLGALAGAAKEIPSIIKSLTEMILEKRKDRRSSIAYIAKFK